MFDNKEKCRNSETEKRLEFITGYNITKGYPLLQDSENAIKDLLLLSESFSIII